MSIRRWEDLKHKSSPERRAEIRRKAIMELVEADLRGIREAAGKTQVDLAAIMDKTQGQISALEKRQDFLLSTLRDFVEACGGELEIIANFGDKRIKLHSAV